jgi:uncharacterized protein (TIGR03083 family)
VAQTTRALAAEAAALQAALAGLTEQDFNLPSPCPPWSVGELLCHVVIGAGRVATALDGSQGSVQRSAQPPGAIPASPALASPALASPALASPALASPALASTADYFRHDARFSAAVDSDRLDAAAALAAELGGPAAVVRELHRRCADSLGLLAAAAPRRVITTRHGDRMLLTDFAGTRVVELAVHGLDLATGLRRPPWLTAEAADLLEELWLPTGHAESLRQQLGCDRAGLIARLTGRVSLSPTEQNLLRDAGARYLALG